MEEIIIKLGHNPKDPKAIKALIKKKEDDIVSLKKQLKLPATMHPQATELVKEKEEEDMMELLIKMNQRLSEIEHALEKALQEKQGELASQPAQTAPIATTAPPTATTSVPPTALASTTGTSATDTSAATTTSVPDTSMSMEKMMEEIKALELQMAELKEAKEKITKLEVSYDKSKITVAEKRREVKALENKVKSLEKDLTLHKTLSEIRTILWTKIGQSITDQWRSIQTIHEQIELIEIA